MVTNPPYGERMGEREELARFYPQLGDALKKNFAGWRCYLFTADLRLPKLIRLQPSARTPLYNGALECRLYAFNIVAGSHAAAVRRSQAAAQAVGKMTRGARAPPSLSITPSLDDVEVLDALGEVLVLRFLAVQLDAAAAAR